MTYIPRTILIVTLWVYSTHQQTCSFHKNVDIGLPSLTSYNPQPEGNCCLLCNNIPQCKGYVWTSHQEGTCWLKSGTSNMTSSFGFNAGILTSNFNSNSKVQKRATYNAGVKCPSIKPSENLNYDVHCSDPLRDPGLIRLNCETDTYVGVRATFFCKTYFKRSSGRPFLTKECQSNGRWSNAEEAFHCDLDCGIKTGVINKYVVNGYVSSTQQWPWFAAIFKIENGIFGYQCGGSLIAKDVILTATHCVTDSSGKRINAISFNIVLGAVSSNWQDNHYDTQSQILLVKEVISHPRYNFENLDADIAILTLVTEAKISDRVHPVCFSNGNKEAFEATKQMSLPGVQGYVVGFGLDETWKISKKLKEIKLPLIDHELCSRTLGRRQTSTQFCAGFTNGSSVCEGDSGGGFYVVSSNIPGEARYYVQGIVNYGVESDQGRHCDNFKYTVFTYVESYQHWVAENIPKAHFSSQNNDYNPPKNNFYNPPQSHNYNPTQNNVHTPSQSDVYNPPQSNGYNPSINKGINPSTKKPSQVVLVDSTKSVDSCSGFCPNLQQKCSLCCKSKGFSAGASACAGENCACKGRASND